MWFHMCCDLATVKPVLFQVLNNSSFYAEAGGQVGDLGLLTNAAGDGLMKVKVVQAVVFSPVQGDFSRTGGT